MEIITNFLDGPGIAGRAVVTLGIFDGVHLGHRQVLKRTVAAAKSADGTSIAITFDPHPRTIFGTDERPLLLTSTEHKTKLLRQLGIDKCIIINFTPEFADISGREFIDLLDSRLDLVKIVLGRESRFGRRREGDVSLVASIGRDRGFEVEVVEPVTVNDVIISSTLIRKYIHGGDLDAAAGCLGRRFSILGTVVKGDSVGRRLGYPTANIDPHNEVIPPNGVYAVRAIVDDGHYNGILYIGRRPTLKAAGEGESVIEVHIFDFDREIYQKAIEIGFEKKIRKEKKFAHREELIDQIKQDEIYAKKVFAQSGEIC